MLQQGITRFRLPILLGVHTVVFAVSLWAAFVVRFDLMVPASQLETLRTMLVPVVLTKLAVFGAFRLYGGWWRYVALNDLLRMATAAAAATVLLATGIFLLQVSGIPRSILLIDLVLTVALLSFIRVTIRLVRERVLEPAGDSRGPTVQTLIAGTGPTAEALLRELARHPRHGYVPVGLLDQSARNVGTSVSGVRIVGGLEDLPDAVRTTGAEQVLIALEEGSGELVRRIVALCASADVRYRVLPTTEALLNGQVSISQLREVNLQDLLGRPPVRLDNEPIARMITGRTVLVTGAGGSIGSELCRQVARFGPAELVLLEQAENPVFHLERELVQTFPDITLVPVIADVYDAPRMERVFARHRPSIVLHAAAHKHVPLMERNPGEAIKNNIIGTLNVIRASQTAEAEVCVLISTDKAVRPTSVMGASKRVSEMLMQSLAPRSTTRLTAVRFGNVLGSNGSVIPIFTEQIRNGGPVTVTHPDMRRYFMTIPEASQLVLQAASLSQGGEIYVLDMGEPVHIVDVARDLIRLSGLEPDVDIPITFTGIRPGEKLFEELATEGEETERTAHDRIFRSVIAPPDADVLLTAADRLHGLSATDAPASHVRKGIFDLLNALEEGSSVREVQNVADNIIRFPPDSPPQVDVHTSAPDDPSSAPAPAPADGARASGVRGG
ncbi:MAG: polysaccharide biosynthesis protein [Deltaproteobacteria bacterium]|nr:MAG: polysaccharide biosynthesis protein [Deltaproteobacteria bacterium]